VIRFALFALVGIAFFVYWLLADPSYEEKVTQSEWRNVLGFSSVILLFALAVPILARLDGRRLAFRTSLVAAAGAALSSIANIFEDGLHMGWVFLFFAVGAGLMLLGLLVLTFVFLLDARGRFRLLALVSAGSIAGILTFVAAGGPIMLTTWLTAAALALILPIRSPKPAAPAAP
jgi:MFS family permease